MDRSRFDPTGFYRAMEESMSLQVARGEVRWMDLFSPPEAPVDVVLAFGCAVQHTPHLMLEACQVFDALGIPFVAVTGRQFCCGRPFQRVGGDTVAADRIAAKSYERFLAFQPKVTVQWCGACMLQYLDVISRQIQPPFEVVHVTKYVLGLLRERGASIPWEREVRSRVLLHTHDQFLPQQEIDARCIERILEMVPGVELVGRVAPPSLGLPCSLQGPTQESILKDITTEEYRAVQVELEEQAREAGADTLVMPYHKCQMEWSKFSSRRLAVRGWMSVLAEALGVGRPDLFTTYWHLNDAEEIVERSAPIWGSWGLSRDEALDRARRHFIPRYAVEVHRCDCGGRGCGAPDLDLAWPTAAP
ncbi:MAG TPA: heterodisulfide reductase-related iron-sulfur binding cluster [Actinomycetota bacterium]|nr:heterodisulfide reductase-related iron-sulfur binding cluster [Actinomycetota bacterium]